HLRRNHPKTLFLCTSNLISTSPKPQQYFINHFLPPPSPLIPHPNQHHKPHQIKSPHHTQPKLHLLLSLHFRMTATPLYSDILLPPPTSYQKHHLSSTHMHPFI
ncbi:molybdopterin-dependent oxidoreductase, partial [Staphylococcus epidermidis]|uniref:molybdopterin-dependent oxidoreductase n=1 Tax=Staphylococcus epidermidis TaxID=1282 RepID=UPI0011AB0502